MDTLHRDSVILRRWGVGAACILISTGLAGCGGGDDSSSPAPTYTVGGSISGLSAGGLVLANGTDTVSPVSGATSFTFPTAHVSGTSYAVTVQSQPTALTCAVAPTGGSGTISSANVTNVQVSCTANTYSIGGTISGLTTGGLVLENGSDTLSPAANAATFTFATKLTSGATYAVTVETQPFGLSCQVSNATGTVPSAAVTNVNVTCSANEWTWVGGADTGNANGVYGTLGTAAAANIPGARYGSHPWTDAAGNMWLFGGIGNDSAGKFDDLNDLWKYSAVTKQWTWTGGSKAVAALGVYGTRGTAAAANTPGARDGGIIWTDSAGNVWLFGGEGYDSTGNDDFLNDLWKYNPATNQWTWVGGPSTAGGLGVYGTQGTAAAANLPGARDAAMGWVDSAGNFWLFGGYGYDSTTNSASLELNDLWMYNTTTNQWTWIGGSNIGNAKGVYGTKGVAAAGNVPGARDSAATWVDKSGTVWLFGGYGYDSAGTTGQSLADLWTYSPSSGQWTWVNGANTGSVPAVYGAQGTAAAANTPGSRFGAVSWIDGAGNFWLFGGAFNLPGGNVQLNDVWEYSGTANQWVWIGGSNTTGAKGVYGTLGTPAATNTPGARYYASKWTDGTGNLWLFGGYGDDSAGTANQLNDLWEY